VGLVLKYRRFWLIESCRGYCSATAQERLSTNLVGHTNHGHVLPNGELLCNEGKAAFCSHVNRLAICGELLSAF
jgi:hypothetical protein